MTGGASPQEKAACDCPNPIMCKSGGCFAAAVKKATEPFRVLLPKPVPDPGWHWRNCRDLSVGITLVVWPWEFAFYRDINVYGGCIQITAGPIEVVINFGIGNVSREPRTLIDKINNATGLSEAEAYERAARWEE